MSRMTTPSALARRIRGLLDELLERHLILLPNAVTSDRREVTWRSPTPLSNFVDFVDYPTIRTYRRWAEANEYMALLPDGALIQMRYEFVDGEIAKHRLAYVPCPYRLDQDLLDQYPLVDVLELHLEDPHDEITMQTAVRFDCDGTAADVGHPHAHLTLNVASCRIACEAPMSPEDFLRFVFSNFYRSQWLEYRLFFDGLARESRQSTVTPDERLEPHVAWRRELASS
jgi:hypothetical protein